MTISIVILARHAAKNIENAIKSVLWGDEILVVDNGSGDDTVDVAVDLGCRVVSSLSESFAELRNIGLEKAQGEWILYVDADEVVPEELAHEIQEITEKKDAGVWKVRRENYFLNTKMYPDKVERLFHKSELKRWVGKVHESPVYDGEAQILQHSLNHYTHTNITSMLAKTNEWSETEAQLRLDANHPPIAIWRMVRVGATYGWREFVQKRVWRFGRAGLFEGTFQIIDKLIVYTKLWERQNSREDSEFRRN